MAFGQSSHDDSLLAHYPLQVGNAWDYHGGFYFMGFVFYPSITCRTAIADSVHTNGHRYSIIEEVTYNTWGRQSDTGLGNIYRSTYLARIDSLSLNVWQIGSGLGSPYGDEFLVDSLRAQVGDFIVTNDSRNRILYFSDRRDSLILGQLREVRSLFLENALVSFDFATAEGLGEILWQSGGEGEPSFSELGGAVIHKDTVGVLIRTQPGGMQPSETRLDFAPNRKTRTVHFRNLGRGLTIVDSVALAHEERFDTEAIYKGGAYGRSKFQKGPFLIFPYDSIRVDFFLLKDTEAFADTLRIYSHSLSGENLPQMKVPMSFSPEVSVDEAANPTSPPGRLILKVHPNPSNAMVTVQFEMKERHLATIRAYDMLGREIAVLLNELQTAGTHRLNWDAHGLGAGVYFIELEAAGERRVQKLLLLK
jgi:hypothetical protein